MATHNEPRVATKLHREILNAKEHILSLGDNWDGDGSPGFREETWITAERLLESINSKYRDKYRTGVPVPSILPVADGSIDMRWKWEFTSMDAEGERAHRILVVNIPFDASEPPSFYGKTIDGVEFGGEIKNKRDVTEISSWLGFNPKREPLRTLYWFLRDVVEAAKTYLLQRRRRGHIDGSIYDCVRSINRKLSASNLGRTSSCCEGHNRLNPCYITINFNDAEVAKSFVVAVSEYRHAMFIVRLFDSNTVLVKCSPLDNIKRWVSGIFDCIMRAIDKITNPEGSK